MPKQVIVRALIICAISCIALVAHADSYGDGRKLLKQRKYGEAIAKLEDAARSDPRPEIRYHLATAYDLSGDRAKALESYRKVVEANGAYARDAARLVAGLEARVAAEATDANQRVDAELEAQKRAQRLADSEARLAAAKTRVAALETEVSTHQTSRDAAVAGAAESKLAVTRAEADLEGWRKNALAAPSGRGRGFRALGLMLGLGGTALLAASAWYAVDSHDIETTLGNLTSCPAQSTPECSWSIRFDPLIDRGERNNGYIELALPSGGVALLLGTALFIHGERVIMPARSADELRRGVEQPR